MALMSVQEVANFLGVQPSRVERLQRESLLLSRSQDDEGQPLFDQLQVEAYQQLAERLGGL